MKNKFTKKATKIISSLIFFLALLLIAGKGYAQTAASYTFAASSGTYSSITGGAVLSSGAGMDDASFSVTIPAFTYLGTVYTQVYASENGFVQFGSSLPAGVVRTYLSSTDASATSGVSGYSRDIRGRATSELRTQTIGSEVIFQWLNMTNFGSTAQTYTFQIRLNTATNVITVVYNAMTSTASTNGQIGLRGTLTDFNNRTSTSNWASTTAGTVNTATVTVSSTVFPTSGQTFTWTPPPPCAAKPVGGTLTSSAGATSICPSTAATLSVTGSTVTTGIAYAWDSSLVSGTGPWFAIAGATAATYSASPAACTNVYYRRRTICTPVGLFDSSSSVLVSVKCALTPPYFEDFESISAANQLPNCMTATNLGSRVYTLTAASTRNRSNHTPGGSKYAYFQWGCDDYLYTPAIVTVAGKTYDFSFWYITDGLTGWDSLMVKSGVVPSAAGMTTILGTSLTALTNTNYKKYTVRFVATTSGVQYFGIHCVATTAPWYLSVDDVALQEVPLCSGTPAPGAPVASTSRVCGLGSVDLDLPALAPALGYVYKWQDSTNGGVWGNDPGRPSFGGTTVPFTTGAFATTTYFRCIVKCTLTGDSAISSVLKVNGGPLDPPYFEDFESITTNNELPQCMSATNLGSRVYTLTAASTRNRSNHTPSGSKYAYFQWSCDDYIFTPELKLVAGQQYIFSFWYITDGLSGWNTLSAKMGTGATPAAMTTSLKTISNPKNTVYTQYADTFTATASGIYHFGIYCNATGAPWYLSIDDIGLQFKPCGGMPTASTIVGTLPSGAGICPNTLTTLTGTGGTLSAIPGIKYQWQRKSIPFGTLWQNMIGANDTLLSADTLGGYDYRLATICMNTNDSAFSSIYSLPLLAVHPPITISPSTSPVSICLGDTVKFNATNRVGSVYDWMLDGVVIPGWKFSDLAATASGTYSVKASSSGLPCPAFSNKVVISRNDPDYSITMTTPSDSFICDGMGLLLSGFGSKAGLTYQWYKDNVLIPGATSNNYLVIATGVYRIKAYDGRSLCDATSRSIRIVVKPNPPAILSVIGGSTTACENEGVLLKASSGAFAYEWIKGGSTVFGWTDSSQLIKNSGIYRVKLRSSDGCASISSPITINILPSPIPLIVRSGFSLSTSSPYVSYLWIRNGKDTLSSFPNIVVGKKGVYKVVVTDPNGCVGESSPIDMFDNALGIESAQAAAQLRIYPNPTNSKVFIESPIELQVEVKDVTGRTIIPLHQTNQIDLGKYADGIYLLNINGEGKLLQQQKITKISQ
jgi:hypothetical protein